MFFGPGIAFCIPLPHDMQNINNLLHPSRTFRTQELQSASAVLNSDKDLTLLSYFSDPGAPECERCDQFWKEFGTALALYGPQAWQGASAKAPAKGPLYTGTKKLPKVHKSDHLANGLGAPSKIKFSGPRPQAPSRKLQVPGHRPQVPGPKHRIQASCHWPQAQA